MKGPQHWAMAQELLADAENADPAASPESVALLLKFADVHFNAARTAAVALQAVLPLVGDDQQVTDWCKAIDVTFATPDSVRIDDALALIDQMEQDGQIADGAERLRQVLRRTNGGS